MFDFLTFPFMQRALVGGVVVAMLLAWTGVYATSRNMSFIGAGIAHASLAAVAFALLVGLSPLPVALVFAVLLGILLYMLEQHSNVSRDTAIGVMFSAGMAFGILLLQFIEGYVPELMSFLFGSILAVSWHDLILVFAVALVMVLLIMFVRRQLLFVTVDPDGAWLAGVNRSIIELLLYIMTSLAVVVSIKLVGIVLVSALLVIPSAVAKPFVRSFAQLEVSAVLVGVLVVLAGLWFSFALDWPSGASIVLTGSALLFVSWVSKALFLRFG